MTSKEAESNMRTALILQLSQAFVIGDHELTDDQALRIVKNADTIARAMMASGFQIIVDGADSSRSQN